MEDNLNSYFPGHEDTTYCSVVVRRDYVSLLGFPLDTAALQSMVVEVPSQIHVDFPQFRSVKWNRYFFLPCCFQRTHQSFPDGSAGLQHIYSSLVLRTRGFLAELLRAAKRSSIPILLVFSVTQFTIDRNKKSKPFNRLSPESGNRKKVDMQRPSPRFWSKQFSYGRYAEKRFPQIYRDLYGDAMLVPT